MTEKSLSSSNLQKLSDSFKVYSNFEKNIFLILYRVFILSINYIKKKLMIINLEKIILLILFSFIIFQLNKIIRNLKVNKLEAHQKYTSSINGNLIGGYSIFFLS